MHFDIEKHTIFEALTGSRTYGFSIPESDYDWRGIAVPPQSTLFGFAENFEQYQEGERTIYDIRKFFNLAKDCNPNIIELLFIPDYFVKRNTIWGETLRKNRFLFLSTKVRFTFSGYAIAQLKRIQTHKKWLLNPLKEEPLREHFGLLNKSELPTSIRNILKASTDKEIDATFGQSTSDMLKREAAFIRGHQSWEKYQEWQRTRNPTRAALEIKYGYDSKHATHLVRLMRMCKEILQYGDVIVDRTHIDADELREIRNGSWSYEHLIKWAEDSEEEIQELYLHCTILPKHPDIKKLNDLCVSITEDFLAH